MLLGKVAPKEDSSSQPYQAEPFLFISKELMLGTAKDDHRNDHLSTT